MANYIGLDAHSKTCTAVVIDSLGKIKDSRKFDTSEGNLVRFLKSVPKPRHLAFEEQGLAHWLFLTVKPHVDHLVVANAYHLPKQRGAKGDHQDAIRLAEELRADRIVSVYHDESKLFNLRTIVNSYHAFTADLVRSKNRYNALMKNQGQFISLRDRYHKSEMLDLIPGDEARCVAETLFTLIEYQQRIKDSYEEKFVALARQWTVIKKLCSIPGISNIRAAMITAIICSPDRFSNKHKLWAYCKLVRYIDVSDGKIYGSRNTMGRAELKAIFMGAATSVLMGTSGLRKYYDRLRTKGTCHNDAKRAVARRIAAIVLMTMKSGKTYDDHHEEKKLRDRTVKS